MNETKSKAGESRAPAARLNTDQAEPEQTHVASEFHHTRPLTCCRFDPTGRFVFAGAEDETVQRWDLESGRRTVQAGHESWVLALAFHPNGQTIVTGGADGKLIWWPAASEKPLPLRTVATRHGWVRSAVVSPDGAVLATCGNDRMVRLWSFADGKLLAELPGHAKPVYRVLFEPGGQSLVSGDLQGVLIQWDCRTGKEARRFDAGKLYKYHPVEGVDHGGVRDLAFSRDGKYLACSGVVDVVSAFAALSNPAVLLVDCAAGKESLLQRPKEDIKGVAWGVRFHPSGFEVAVSGGMGGGLLWFWKPGQVHEFFKFTLPNTGRDLDLHPDGLRLATAHHDGLVRISAMRRKSG
jgi:WD40 repeat protein